MTATHEHATREQHGARSAHASLLAAALALAPDPTATQPAATELVVEVTSVGCDLHDAELERLLVLELSDLPQAARGFGLHVELRCDSSEIGILVREPVRGTSLQRNIEAPEAAVGRERVLALAIRQLVDTSFLELVTARPIDLDAHGSPQTSQGDDRAPPVDPASPDQPEPDGPADEPTAAPADLVAGGRAASAQGPAAARTDQARLAPVTLPVWLGVELGALGRGLDARPLAAARLGLFVAAPVARRWSVLGAVASDWTTIAAPGGRIHAVHTLASGGARARLALGRGPFIARLGADLGLGWGRVLGVAEPGFIAQAVDGVVFEGRVVAGLWAEGPRSALGLDLAVGGGPRTPVGTTRGGAEVSLGGAFVGLLVGGSLR